jgi:hypothetical protein
MVELNNSKIYRHYKGGLYRYITDANLEWCYEDPNSHVIVYESLETGLRWVRSRNEFFGYVEIDGKLVRRFEIEGKLIRRFQMVEEKYENTCPKCGSKFIWKMSGGGECSKCDHIEIAY